ncbi:type II secretion system F family protein [Enorma burkinafasonensis]|uniref:type II secretion system F family protein n=1 Tax=Enorma burkinafasonensis TaxID=2590867 RepID=UPI0011AA5A29|nr:type II secretion system F family protein [Enorma burkinafasonensis]
MEAFLPLGAGIAAAAGAWALTAAAGPQPSADCAGGAWHAASRDALRAASGWVRALGARLPRRLSSILASRGCLSELERVVAAACRRAGPGSAAGATARELIQGLWLCITVAAAAAGAAVASSPWGAPVGAALPTAVLAARGARRKRAERRRVEAAMPEAFSALAISLGSGHTLAQGMRFVGGHAEEPIRTEFLRVACSIDCGVPAASALDDLLARLPAPGLGLVSLALKVSQRTGAPLRDLLADAAAMVSERMELVRKLDVKTSQARMSARLVALMPIAMIGALTLLSPDFRAGLGEPVGMGSVAVALALNVCAWLIIRRIMEVEV